MKKTILALVLLLVMPVLCKAQARFLVGGTGADSFSNLSLGITGSLEAPFAKHYEFDLQDTFSPIEYHASLGSGKANQAKAGGHVWLNSYFGLSGIVEYSGYNTNINKAAFYAIPGVTFKTYVAGFPSRISVGYIRQFQNGVSKSGIETSHLQGLNFIFDTRLGCKGKVCFRLREEVQVGGVLEQGNPQCDGSIGPKTCGNRIASIGGGISDSFLIEFGGKKNDLF